ncbi:hypothetical protein LEQ_0385 [Ligilactobacillus equi DPC 6820]|uniref:Uncharacterized protein n=2 Tax=Ligilactobacillus equi TaxID=137357 RepID=V7HZ00_9LACO|nr:hypothetical protein LEQ_0385 [Ligilactobacillus equi DPC 6820]
MEVKSMNKRIKAKVRKMYWAASEMSDPFNNHPEIPLDIPEKTSLAVHELRNMIVKFKEENERSFDLDTRTVFTRRKTFWEERYWQKEREKRNRTLENSNLNNPSLVPF